MFEITVTREKDGRTDKVAVEHNGKRQLFYFCAGVTHDHHIERRWESNWLMYSIDNKHDVVGYQVTI